MILSRPRRTPREDPEASKLEALIQAIVDDAPDCVACLIRSKPELAGASMPRSMLYETGIQHWIYRGDTPLHLAAAGHRDLIVTQLLGAGAVPNCRGPHRGTTPLHYAADGFITGDCWDARRQIATLRFLIEAGADLRLADKNGATALHRAVRTRSSAAVRCLLDAGADPAIENNAGSTPLHLAVQNTGRGGSGAPACIAAQREILESLLRHGLNPHLPNRHGRTPFASARQEWIRALLVGKDSGKTPKSSK